MEKWIDLGVQYAKAYGPKVLAALAILVIGWIVAKLIRGALKKVLRRASVEETLITFLGNLTYMLMIAFVVIAALSQLGVDTTSFAAIIAAAGLAIGLALQGSLGNFASGVMIIGLKPFKVGDYVEAGGVAGVVEGITVFATNMRTPDNKSIIVPNGAITGGNIVNFSAKDTRRVDLVAGVSYTDDLQKVKQVLQELVAADARVLKDPEPTIAVSELADSSVNFVVRPWVNKDDYWNVYFGLTEAIKRRFDQEGISIPFPQQDVHLFQSGQAG